jgi:hypothetical protein
MGQRCTGLRVTAAIGVAISALLAAMLLASFVWTVEWNVRRPTCDAWLADGALALTWWRPSPGLILDARGFYISRHTGGYQPIRWVQTRATGAEISVAVPLWLPLLLSTVVTALPLRRPPRATLRGRCSTCGYDLTGNTSGRCPECGTAVEADTDVVAR